jgi:hypothetical protein
MAQSNKIETEFETCPPFKTIDTQQCFPKFSQANLHTGREKGILIGWVILLMQCPMSKTSDTGEGGKAHDVEDSTAGLNER